MSNVNTGNMSDGIKTLYEKSLLIRAVPRMLHGRFGKKATINRYGSLEWRKYGSLSAVDSPLSEGNTPVETVQPSITTITATPSWYGAFVGYTDEMEMTQYDAVINEISGILGEQAGLSIDTISRNAVTAGATKIYAGTATARGEVGQSSEVIAYLDFLTALATLMANNALPFDNGMFDAVIHPNTWGTLFLDTNFKALFIQESSTDGNSPLRSGYMGTILNVRLFITSNARLYAGAGDTSSDVYSLLIFGKEAYGMVGIGNTLPTDPDMADEKGKPLTGTAVKPVSIIAKPVGSAGAADPLDQRGTLAWKASHDLQILNAAFFVDIEHASTL